MPNPSTAPVVQFVLDYIWVPLVAWLVAVSGKQWGLHTKQSLLLQQQENFQKELDQFREQMLGQRQEDRELYRAQREEIMSCINSYHRTAMSKLEAIEARLNDFLARQAEKN